MVEFFIIAGVLGFFGLIVARQFTQREERAQYLQTLGDKKGMPGELRCPKCQGAMVQGFVPDKEDCGFKLTSWVEGPAHGTVENVKVKVEHRVPIGAFRCSGCGYLELYARPEFEPTK